MGILGIVLGLIIVSVCMWICECNNVGHCMKKKEV